jgi:uncharacterized FlaG/YvyC family protein
MTIDSTTPAIAQALSSSRDSIPIQAENRKVIQAVRAVNASGTLGRNEMTFSINPHTRRPVITIVNSDTNEVVDQIPNDQVLRLSETLQQAE